MYAYCRQLLISLNIINTSSICKSSVFHSTSIALCKMCSGHPKLISHFLHATNIKILQVNFFKLSSITILLWDIADFFSSYYCTLLLSIAASFILLLLHLSSGAGILSCSRRVITLTSNFSRETTPSLIYPIQSSSQGPDSLLRLLHIILATWRVLSYFVIVICYQLHVNA